MSETAVVLANGHLDSVYAKTTHGLVRGPSRYRLLSVIDANWAGQDAGSVLFGKAQGIPVHASLSEALSLLDEKPDNCIVGVATEGGVLPEALRPDLLLAAQQGISLVNGLHQFLADDPDLRAATTESGARILDLRRPRPTAELSFWSGRIRALSTPRLAVLGTDCALGKRTTCNLLQAALRAQGTPCEVIYTGQTGWLQGHQFGFFFDATANDFVSGELEAAILDCDKATNPELILIEGQSALRNPSGPCGSEFILSAGVRGIILQHAPKRACYLGFEGLDLRIPALAEEIELIRVLGAEVWAICVHEEGMTGGEAEAARAQLATEHDLPTFLPLSTGIGGLAELLRARLEENLA